MGRKETIFTFYSTNKRKLTREDLDMAEKGNLKIETDSLLIAAQNHTIKTKHDEANIYKTQQNSKCRSCGDRNKFINHIISECVGGHVIL